jgi:hypothetical protein
VNLERASRNIDGLTLVPTNGLEAYDLLRHDHLMMSREAAVKLSRALSPNPQEQEQPIQIQPAPGASSKQTVAEKTVHAKPVAKTHLKTEAAPKAAKKHAAGTKEKPKAKSKPKAKKE